MLTQNVGIASTVVDVIPSRVAFRVVIMRRLPRLRPLIAIAIASPLGAQGLCWTARPSPACPAWIVTEIGGELPVYSTSVINRSETRRLGEGCAGRRSVRGGPRLVGLRALSRAKMNRRLRMQPARSALCLATQGSDRPHTATVTIITTRQLS